MKNIKFFLLSLIAVTLLFSACSDLSKDTSGNQKKSQYTVLGSLSFAGVSRAVYSRTATTAFSDEPVWTISATKGEKSYLPNEVSDLAFNFTFDEAGEYLIEATALKEGKIIAQGSCLCMVSADKENFASIIAKPVASILPGSVNLEINLDSYSANKVSSVQVEWLGFVNIDRTKQALGYPSGAELTGDAKEPEISEEVQAAIAALIDWEEQRSEGKFNKTLPVESGKAVIEMDNIFCGAHTVKLSFSDSVGNTLYSCKEILNVYSGFTTNEWYGTAPYLNNGTFTLTENLVEKYGTDLVPSTDYMLYDYNSSESEFDYYFMDDYTKSLPATATLSTSYNSFALDADGYYYVVTKTLESAVFIKSNRPGFCSEAASDTAYQYPGSMYINGFFGDKVLVDRKTGFLYLIDKSNLASIGINRLTKDDGTYDYESENTHAYYPAKKFQIPETDSNRSIVVDSTAFTIYGGIGYFVCMEDEKLLIAVVDLRNYASNSTNADAFVSRVFEIPNMSFSYDSSLTDVMYMDGELYILERDYNTGGSLQSRGMIIKCNAITGEYTYKGLAPERQLMSYKSGCFYVDNENHVYSVVYNSEDHSDYHIEEFSIENEENAISIQAPFDNLNSYFAGPNKFVAIKPKKLVISDTGIAFYTDTDGAVYFKDVNRIVEVDLKTLSITSSTDVQLSFDSPSEDNLSLSGFPSATVTGGFIYNNGRWDSIGSNTLPSTFTKKQ